jgi:hypothetical protein
MSYNEYGRLTRSRVRHSGFMTVVAAPRSSLWLGRDHILKIDSMRFTEEYKRFYFRDIQAITICTTRRRAIWNLVLTLGMSFFVAVLVMQPGPGAVVFTVVSLSILGVFLIANNVLGPTCAVYLRTAVQIDQLGSLNRVRRAHSVLDRLRPLITAAQGRLGPDELSSRLRENAETPESL